MPGRVKVLYLDLNSFFASVEQAENAALRGKPVAVVPVMSDTTCAIAASYEAKAYGVKTGTSIWEAKKMCPGLQSVLARHDIYRDYHDEVRAAMESCVPVDRAHSIDEFSATLIGREQEPENAVAIANAIKVEVFRRVGEAVRCSIGIAPSLFLAKVATEIEKPDGLVVLRPEDLPEKLYCLGLRDLPGIGAQMEKRLHRAGVSTIPQFWALAPKQARKIWGSVVGERFWYNLRGIDIPYEEHGHTMIGHSRVLDPALRPPDRAWLMARRLTVKAAARLRRQGFYARSFALSVRTTYDRRWGGELRFPAAQDNFTFLWALGEMWPVMIKECRPHLLKKVSVVLSGLIEPEQVTDDLFIQNTPRRWQNLSVAMDELNRKYGCDAIHVGEIPQTETGYVGTKIAFTRIPDKAEFWE